MPRACNKRWILRKLPYGMRVSLLVRGMGQVTKEEAALELEGAREEREGMGGNEGILCYFLRLLPKKVLCP